MPVFLCTSRRLPDPGRFDAWCAVGRVRRVPDGVPRLAGLGAALEEAFDQGREVWRQLARRLARDPSAGLGNAPACAVNVSDLGLMLAWTRLLQARARAPERLLVVCDDPWMYRHLGRLLITPLSPPPRLWPKEAKLALRGGLARAAYAAKAAASVLRYRRLAGRHPAGVPTLLSYAHPASDGDGTDAYFGDLMQRYPTLHRVLQVDLRPDRIRALAGTERTLPLAAWGRLRDALRLFKARWRPDLDSLAPGLHWLVRRAAALEGGTAQGAAVRWQQVCQHRFLAAARPLRLLWPWENHNWERSLVRAARALDVASVGYQHATVGRQEWNYAPLDEADLPDRILCTGEAWRTALADFGVPEERMVVAGALRSMTEKGPVFDPQGPVFVALPFDRDTAREMVDAAAALAGPGCRVLVRDHPMVRPATLPKGLDVADGGMSGQRTLSAVVYAGSTVGLEAILAGLPVVRFLPVGRVLVDPVPAGLRVVESDADALVQALSDARAAPEVPKGGIHYFALPDAAVWTAAVGVDLLKRIGDNDADPEPGAVADP